LRSKIASCVSSESDVRAILEDHEMTVVAVDGVATKPAAAQAITLAAGQRYDVIITGKTNATRNYEITSQMFGTNLSRTGVLNYGFNDTEPTANSTTAPAAIDDITLSAASGQTLFGSVARNITLPVSYTGTAGRR
jgi:iron transport multicopper oxidase